MDSIFIHESTHPLSVIPNGRHTNRRAGMPSPPFSSFRTASARVERRARLPVRDPFALCLLRGDPSSGCALLGMTKEMWILSTPLKGSPTSRHALVRCILHRAAKLHIGFVPATCPPTTLRSRLLRTSCSCAASSKCSRKRAFPKRRTREPPKNVCVLSGFCRHPASGAPSAKLRRRKLLPITFALHSVPFAVSREPPRNVCVSYVPLPTRKRAAQCAARFLVGRGGFEPPKSKTSDLQSDPFGRSGIFPYMKL